MTTLQFIHCANAHLRLRSSGYDGKSRPELHQLEHFVNIDVHAAQRDLDAFVVSCVGEPLQRSDCARIDPAHRREIHNPLFINLYPHGDHCHTHHHSATRFVAETHRPPSPDLVPGKPSKTARPIRSPVTSEGSTAPTDPQRQAWSNRASPARILLSRSPVRRWNAEIPIGPATVLSPSPGSSPFPQSYFRPNLANPRPQRTS